MTTPAAREYLVDLETFRGPLDLLLYLVKREEVDVRDIPIARIAEQFKHYLDVLSLIDVERAGEFLVMAATLMEIKSRLLLPRTEESTEPDDDPRQELVRQLLEYKQFKDAAALLEARATEHNLRLPRLPPAPALTDPAQLPLREVELWDLVSAFSRLMRETLTHAPQQIVDDATPLHVYMDQIVERLRNAARLPFAELFTPPFSRIRLIGLFLGVLELTRQGRIVPEQDRPFGDLWVAWAPDGGASRASTDDHRE